MTNCKCNVNFCLKEPSRARGVVNSEKKNLNLVLASFLSAAKLQASDWLSARWILH